MMTLPNWVIRSIVIAAAINAWPGMGHFNYSFPHVLLPLPQEAGDE